MSDDDKPIECDLCGDRPHEYVVLNRWAAIHGHRGMMVSEAGKQYKWRPNDGTCSGVALCVPGCLVMWVEAQLVEVAKAPSE